MKKQPKKPRPEQASERATRRGSSDRRGERSPLSSGRRWLFRIISVGIIPLLLLGVIEAGLRLAGYGFNPALFKRITINREQFYVNNESFSLRFFPPQMTRGLGAIRIPVHKPAGTYRIFILGESAAVGDPEPAYGAGRYLEALLGARYPGTHFEIINTGITAVDSHVILPIARECARYDGDLWIIYMGNNEMVGPFGAATVFGAKAPPLPLIRLNLAIQKTRLGQLLINIGRKLKGENEATSSWGGMEMFVSNQLPTDDPRKEVVYHNFSRNLHDILKAGLDSGAKVLLNTMAVNLKDCAPFASLVSSNLPPAERAQFDQDFKNGVQAEDRGNFAEAVKAFALASALDPQVAELQFRWGQSLLQIHEYVTARKHLQLACDDDALPFRTDSRLNSIIAETGRQMANNHLVLFNADLVLASNLPSKILGDETFYEHVHFNFDGNYRLGRAWADQVAELLPAEITRAAATNDWASQAICEQRLGLSDWNRTFIYQEMIDRLKKPPLSDQLDNTTRMNKLEAQVKDFRSRMNATAAAQAEVDFKTAVQGAPDDYFLRENYAVYLQLTGNLLQATAQWRQILDLLPQDFLANFELGRMLELQSQWADSEASFRRAVELRPTLTDGWIELGNVMAYQGQFEGALASYATALKQLPQDGQIMFRSGKVLAKLNKHAEAMKKYRAAIKVNPSDWEPHFELGGELDSIGQIAEAGKEFGEAVRLNPENAQTHFNYGVLLAKQNQLDEAQHEFEETTRLAPTYARAQEYLAQIQMLKKRAQ
jgi:tetratricopeptide (TPR) repeat protein